MGTKRRHPVSTPAVPPSEPLFDRWSWKIIAGGAIVVPLVIGFRTYESFRLPKQLLFQAIAIAVATLIAAGVVLRKSDLWRRMAEERSAAMLAAAAIAWALIGTAVSSNRVLSAYAVLWLVAALVIFLAATAAIRGRSLAALALPLIAAVPNAVVLLLQARGVWNPIRVPAEITGRSTYTALIGNPDDVGVYFVVPALVAMTLAIVDRRHRIVYAGAAALLVAATLATLTLTAIVTLAVGAAVLATLANRRAGVVMIVALPLALAATLWFYPPLRARTALLLRAVEERNFGAMTSYRLVSFATAWEMFADHPLAGVGPGCFAFQYMPYRVLLDERHPALVGERVRGQANFGEAHNDHLQVLAESGAPGYAIFLAALVLVASRSLRKGDAEEDPRARAARLLALPLAASLFVACLAQFPLHLAAPLYEYLFVGAACTAWSRPHAA